MKLLSALPLLALALAACRNGSRPAGPGTMHEMGQAGTSEKTPQVTAPVPPVPGSSQQLNAPYSGYPGPVTRSADAGAGAGPADAGPAPADAGAVTAPPSTAMPAARPFYPDAGTDGGARR